MDRLRARRNRGLALAALLAGLGVAALLSVAMAFPADRAAEEMLPLAIYGVGCAAAFGAFLLARRVDRVWQAGVERLPRYVYRLPRDLWTVRELEWCELGRD